jgi:hypothetical protein
MMTANRVKPALLIAALILPLVSACGQPVAGEAVAAAGDVVTTATKPPRTSSRATGTTRLRPPASPASSASSTPSTSDKLDSLVGTWAGEYTCGQGNTGLKLTIKDPRGPSLPAVFDFFPLPGNPDAKKGSYSMVGSLSGSGQLVFRQEKWIDQPPGYVMVDLAVTSPLESNVKQLSGDVLEPSCKGFSVRRP